MKRTLAALALCLQALSAWAFTGTSPVALNYQNTSAITTAPGAGYSDTAYVYAPVEGVYDVYVTPVNMDKRLCTRRVGCPLPLQMNGFRTTIDSITVLDEAGAVVSTLSSVATPVNGQWSTTAVYYATTSYHLTVYLRPGTYRFVQTGMVSGVAYANPTGDVSGLYNFWVMPPKVACQGTSVVAATYSGMNLQMTDGKWLKYWYTTVLSGSTNMVGNLVINEAPYLVPGTPLIGLNVSYVGTLDAASPTLDCVPTQVSFF